MKSKFLWWLFVESTKPPPPHVEKTKRFFGDVRAAAELTNMILPEPPKEH